MVTTSGETSAARGGLGDQDLVPFLSPPYGSAWTGSFQPPLRYGYLEYQSRLIQFAGEWPKFPPFLYIDSMGGVIWVPSTNMPLWSSFPQQHQSAPVCATITAPNLSVPKAVIPTDFHAFSSICWSSPVGSLPLQETRLAVLLKSAIPLYLHMITRILLSWDETILPTWIHLVPIKPLLIQHICVIPTVFCLIWPSPTSLTLYSAQLACPALVQPVVALPDLPHSWPVCSDVFHFSPASPTGGSSWTQYGGHSSPSTTQLISWKGGFCESGIPTFPILIWLLFASLLHQDCSCEGRQLVPYINSSPPASHGRCTLSHSLFRERKYRYSPSSEASWGSRSGSKVALAVTFLSDKKHPMRRLPVSSGCRY